MPSTQRPHCRHGRQARLLRRSETLTLAACLGVVFLGVAPFGGMSGFINFFFGVQPEVVRKDIDAIQKSLQAQGLSEGDVVELKETIQESKGLQTVMMPLLTNADVSMSAEALVEVVAALMATMNVQRRYTPEERTVPEELQPYVVYAVQQQLAGNASDSARTTARLIEKGLEPRLAQFHVAQRCLMSKLEDETVKYSGIQLACAEAKEFLSTRRWQDTLNLLERRGMSVAEVADSLRLGIALAKEEMKLAEAT
eukprot:CAMPEP_0117557084 /NCGR_PEP_ID=MMETSP0784-20121206/52143_1 /TAXON_ID=39447 /ORGANISM="" /LENGTH=253 /DNA_ID=CAMNT_0005354381 /DNA_START=68 /DNA_END=829 /DNA_ORIENTATION=-